MRKEREWGLIFAKVLDVDDKTGQTAPLEARMETQRR